VVFDPYHHILCGNILTGIEDFELPPQGVSTAFVSPNPACANILVPWPGTAEMTTDICPLPAFQARPTCFSSQRTPASDRQRNWWSLINVVDQP